MVARGVTARVEGLDRLVRTLNRAALDITDLKDANKSVGEVVAGEAVMRAPRGKTGKLAGSIRSARQARRARVVVGRASVPYAGPIHWGWPARNIAAQPFAATAAQATEPRWSAMYRDAVIRLLGNVKGV